MSDDLIFQFSTCQPETWAARYIPFCDPSALIRRATQSPFSHVDLMLQRSDMQSLSQRELWLSVLEKMVGDYVLLGSSDSPDAPVIAGSARGVAIRPHDYQLFGARRRAVVRTLHKAAIIDYMVTQLGKPFDHSALKPSVFLADRFDKRDWRTPDKWFCAELAARACEEGGLWPYPLIAIRNRVTPGRFLLLLLPFLVNAVTFWDPIEGLELMPGEIRVSRYAPG